MAAAGTTGTARRESFRSTSDCCATSAAARFPSRSTRAISGIPKTLLPEVARLQKRFGLQPRVAIVGDRGMIAQTRITELKKLDGVDWITALKSATIQKLIRTSSLDVARFDEVNLFEVLHRTIPVSGWWPVATRGWQRGAPTRASLLKATEADLAVIRRVLRRGPLSLPQRRKIPAERRKPLRVRRPGLFGLGHLKPVARLQRPQRLFPLPFQRRRNQAVGIADSRSELLLRMMPGTTASGSKTNS